MTAAFSHPAFERIVAIVSDRTGLQVPRNRSSEAEAGIRRAMGKAGVREVSQYLELVRAEELSLDDLVTELTVRESYFFREAAHFDFIRQVVIPEVIGRRGHDHVPRVWCAGSAAGEEPHSLAIALEEDGLAANVLATDISHEALRRAREAIYGRWSLRGLDDTRLSRWFQRAGERWQLDARIRQRVSFAFHNLAKHAYPSVPAGIWGMDLILCRNVLIYFDRPGVEHVARGLQDSLAEGGWLITGPSDPSLDGLGSLRAVTTDAGVFYRRSGSASHAETPPAIATSAKQCPASPPGPGRRAPSMPALPSTRDIVADPREAFAQGRYESVRALTRDARDESSAVLYVRATANCRSAEEAVKEARSQAERHPMCAELHFLEAALLLGAGQPHGAARAIRKVLYLDRSSVVAHLFLGSIHRRAGRLEEARRAYRNARDFARARPTEQRVPLAEGERAGSLADMANAELLLLETSGGPS